jgi:hypothetical protein
MQIKFISWDPLEIFNLLVLKNLFGSRVPSDLLLLEDVQSIEI